MISLNSLGMNLIDLKAYSFCVIMLSKDDISDFINEMVSWRAQQPFSLF